MATASREQTRLHAGHSHHHHHNPQDNLYLTSKNKNDAGVRITRIGLLVNLSMACGKGVGGYYFHSQALIADAIHSLTDLVSDIMTLATVSWSLKPPTSKFPTGYGKVESLGSLSVSALLLAGGLWMGTSALSAICSQFFPDFAALLQDWGILGHSHGHDHGHSHSHSHTDLGPNINAAWLAGGSIVVKEWLYRATMKIAKDRKSSVLASNAVHHRIDSLTAMVALLMIGGSHFLNNASWLDPVGGLIISTMVIRAGFGNSKAALLELADVGVDEEMRTSVRKAAIKALNPDTGVKGVEGGKDVELREIQGIKSGQNYLMELELAVPADWSVEQTHLIEQAVRERVGSKVRGVRRVKVRFVPKVDSSQDFLDEFIGQDVSPRSSPEPESEEEHNHDHDHDHGHAHQNGNTKKIR